MKRLMIVAVLLAALFGYLLVRVDPGCTYETIAQFPAFSLSAEFLHEHASRPGGAAEYAAALVAQLFRWHWLAALLVTDILTIGGLLAPRLAPRLLGWSALIAAVLAIASLVQGLRSPVVRDYEVMMPGLTIGKEIEKAEKELSSVAGQLSNEHFVQKAPPGKVDMLRQRRVPTRLVQILESIEAVSAKPQHFARIGYAAQRLRQLQQSELVLDDLLILSHLTSPVHPVGYG